MRKLTCIGLAVVAFGSAGPSTAATPSGAVSFDLYNGPADQVTKSALALGDLAFGGADVVGGVLRFDDTTVGMGNGFVVGGGWTVAAPLSVRVLASRFVGDGDYRAWRLKSGPQWGLPGGGTLGLFWVHDTNNVGPDTESGAGELSVPVTHGWTGKLSGAYGRSEESDGYVAAVGASWTAVPHLELSGEVGAARNPPATTPAPSRGLLSPILGGPQQEQSMTNQVSATSTLTLRVAFP
jgi:hypothetical protein